MSRLTGLRGLQEWSKQVTQGYSGVQVTNLTTSFRNGLAFCAIIHHYRPDLIHFDSLKPENILDNNQLAYSIAEQELDISALLDAEDMVDLSVPDKLSVATYLIQYYNYFKDKPPLGKGVSNNGTSLKPPSSSPSPRQPAAPSEGTRVVTSSTSTKTPPLSKITSSPNHQQQQQQGGKWGRNNTNQNVLLTGSNTASSRGNTSSSSSSSSSPSTNRLTKETAVNNTSPKITPKNSNPSPKGSPKISSGWRGVGRPPRPTNAPQNGSPQVFKANNNNTSIFGGTQSNTSVTKVTIPSKPPPPTTTSVGSKVNTPSKSPVSNGGGVRGRGGGGAAPVGPAKKEPTPDEKPQPSKAMPPQTPPTSNVAPPTLSTTLMEQKKSRRSRKSKFKSEDSGKIEVGPPSKQEPPSKHEPPSKQELPSKQEPPSKQGPPSKQEPPKPLTSSNIKGSAVKAEAEKSTPGGVTVGSKGQHHQVVLRNAVPHHSQARDSKRGTMGMEKCEACGERVFLMERLGVENKVYHRTCFKCSTCQTKLKAGSYEYDAHTDKFYCRQHYREVLRNQTISRVMAERGLDRVEGEKNKGVPPNVEGGEGKDKGVSPKVEGVKDKGASNMAPSSHSVMKLPASSATKASSSTTKTPSSISISTSIAKPSPYKSTSSSDLSGKSDGSRTPPTKNQAPPTENLSKEEELPYKPPRRKLKHAKSTDTAAAKSDSKIPAAAAATSTETPPSITPKTETPPSSTPKTETPPSSTPKTAEPSKLVPQRPSIRPKRVAPPRPNRPSNINTRGVSRVLDQSQKRKVRITQLRKELGDLESVQSQLEEKGVEIERQLRGNEDLDVDDRLMEEWFEMVQKKTKLVRQESELVYELKDLELVEQHENLDKEIRKRILKDDSKKSEMEKLEDEAMINELVELVEKRDKLMWALHEEKQLEEEQKTKKLDSQDFFQLQKSKTTHL